MGVAGRAILVVAALVAGAVATAAAERALLPAAAEKGPATRAVLSRRRLPSSRDPWLHQAAPVVALLGAAWAAAVLPLSRDAVGADLSIGVFYYVVVFDFVLLALALGGWGANTASSVESCYRAVAQLVGYVIPLGLALLGPIMMARSLSTVAIVEAQREAGLWYVLVQPQGFALYLATALMQSYRAPFLEPFAARLGAGVLGVSGGWHSLLWRLALSGVLLLVAAMGAVCFLGGYAGPWLPGPVWMALKTFALVALLVRGGRRFRLRSTAEMLALSWKVLIPFGLLNVLVVGVFILLGVAQAPFEP